MTSRDVTAVILIFYNYSAEAGQPAAAKPLLIYYNAAYYTGVTRYLMAVDHWPVITGNTTDCWTAGYVRHNGGLLCMR